VRVTIHFAHGHGLTELCKQEAGYAVSSPTPFEFLLVSNNYKTLCAVSEGIKPFGARLGFVPAADSARDYIGRRKLDGIFVDLEVPGALELILSIRQGSSNRRAVIFACFQDNKESAIALAPGADFLLGNPLTVESVATQTAAARDMMARERRHYFRHPLNIPVVLKADEMEQHGRMTNLGEGGMAVRSAKPLVPSSLVEFALELPSAQTLSGKGIVAWANSEGMSGIKFQFFRGQGQDDLQAWLANCERIPSGPVTPH